MQAESSPHCTLRCPADMQESVFQELPLDLRRELCAQGGSSPSPLPPTTTSVDVDANQNAHKKQYHHDHVPAHESEGSLESPVMLTRGTTHIRKYTFSSIVPSDAATAVSTTDKAKRDEKSSSRKSRSHCRNAKSISKKGKAVSSSSSLPCPGAVRVDTETGRAQCLTLQKGNTKTAEACLISEPESFRGYGVATPHGKGRYYGAIATVSPLKPRRILGKMANDTSDKITSEIPTGPTDLTPPRRVINFPTTTTGQVKGSSNYDPDFLNNLPEDIRLEILSQEREDNQQINRDRPPSTGQINESNTTTEEVQERPNYDPDVLNNLPEDIRMEILSLERDNQQHRDTSQPPPPPPQQQQQQQQQPSTTGRINQRGSPNTTYQVKPRFIMSSVIIADGDNNTEKINPLLVTTSPKINHDSSNDCSNLFQSAANQRSASLEVLYANGSNEQHQEQPSSLEPEQSQGEEERIGCRFNGDRDKWGRRSGKGELRWQNGDIFRGMFVDGVRNGPGTLSLHDGSTYEGNWKNNDFDGFGVRKFPNGYVYAGNFQNGRFHGYGKCDFPDGDTYEGDWCDGLMDGIGKYRHNRNGDVYEGMFRSGKRNGPGRYRYKNKRTDIIRYIDGERFGEGVRWSRDGKKAWLLSGRDVICKLSKEAAMAKQQQICDNVDVLDGSIFLRDR